MSNTDRTFAVILNRKSIVDNALTALVKRATRKGVPIALSWSWGKAYRSEIRLPNQDGVPPAAGAQLDATSSAWIVPVAPAGGRDPAHGRLALRGYPAAPR